MAPALLEEGDDLAPHVGAVVTLRGVVTSTKIPTLCGVDVEDCRFGGRVEATGTLVATTTTQAELDALIARVGQVAHRGAGTTYRLVDATTGLLIRPTRSG